MACHEALAEAPLSFLSGAGFLGGQCCTFSGNYGVPGPARAESQHPFGSLLWEWHLGRDGGSFRDLFPGLCSGCGWAVFAARHREFRSFLDACPIVSPWCGSSWCCNSFQPPPARYCHSQSTLGLAHWFGPHGLHRRNPGQFAAPIPQRNCGSDLPGIANAAGTVSGAIQLCTRPKCRMDPNSRREPTGKSDCQPCQRRCCHVGDSSAKLWFCFCMLINTNEYTWRILMAVYTCIYIYTWYRPLMPAWPEAGRAKTSRAAVFINMIKPISERNAHASLNVPWTCLIQIHVSAMEGQREREWERERERSHISQHKLRLFASLFLSWHEFLLDLCQR